MNILTGIIPFILIFSFNIFNSAAKIPPHDTEEFKEYWYAGNA